MTDLLAAALLLVGAALALLAGVGLHRFGSLYSRMHAATKPATLGLVFVVVATALRLGEAGATAKLVLVIVLQFATAPIAGHLIARAAHRVGEPLGPRSVVDELRALEEQEAGEEDAERQRGERDRGVGGSALDPDGGTG